MKDGRVGTHEELQECGVVPVLLVVEEGLESSYTI